MQRSTVSRTSFGRIANTLAGSTPGLIVPIARIFVVGVDVVMGCAYPEFGPRRLKIRIRPAERACFIYLLHNVGRLIAQSLLMKQTVALISVHWGLRPRSGRNTDMAGLVLSTKTR